MALSFLSRNLRLSLVLAGVLAGTTSAFAQSVYLPVQYQFGRYGEIYYGGSNGSFVSNPYLFAPEFSRNAALGQSYNSGSSNGLPSPYTPAITPLAESMGWPSADYRTTEYHVPYAITKPLIYSDLEPGVDVGNRGFTINDARNEAYFNIPRYMAGPDAGKAAEPEAEMGPVVRPLTRAEAAQAKKMQALELINWAKAEHAKGNNPKLVAALLDAAAKYDSRAAAKARADMK